MRILIPLAGLLIVSSLTAEEIYKWVDDSGQVHFSDVPRDGATEVDLGPVQTFSAPEVPQRSASSSSVATELEVVEYEAMEIVSPAMEETIWNTGGKVTITVQLRPGLQTGHQIRLYLNGTPLPNLSPGTSSLQVSDVIRGEHQVKAEVRDENGTVLISADPSKFFYQQTSVNRR